jgi:localization factor PodJL
MAAGVPRNARQVDPASRQLAEDLARRSGLSLNEWVSRLMAEGPEDATSQDYFSQSSQSYVEAPRADAQPRYETVGHPADEVGRVTQAIERLSERIQSAESRQALAIAGIERSVRDVIGRIDAAEREQMHTGARLDGALQDIKGDATTLAQRLRKMEEEAIGPRSAEALRALEGMTARVGAAERQQAQLAARLEGVQGDASAIGQRLHKIEAETGGTEALAARLAAAEHAQAQIAARLEGALSEARGDASDLGQRLSKVEENAGGADTLNALEAVTARVEAAEREQVQVAARFEGALQEIKSEAGGLSGRLEKIETEAAGPRTAEALRAIEGAIGQVAGHVYDSEKRSREVMSDLRGRVERLDIADSATASAIRELKDSCTALDQRLSLADRGAEAGVERVAAQLSARVDATREELARQLSAAADARFDRVEQALVQMSDHVRTAEQRSADALERMGREVLEVAQTLNRRVQSSEQTSNAATHRVSAEVSRIAGAVEDRLARADSMQAQALEKLGGEIARITERLADRIASVERRSAQAIDDVGEQVARVTERMDQRNERSVSELSERIRQSEERTAKLLEDARQKLDDRLAETQRRLVEPPPARPAPPFEAARFDPADDAEEALFADAPFPSFATAPAGRPDADAAPAPAARPAPTPFDEEDFAAASAFGDATRAYPFDNASFLPDAAPPPAAAPAPQPAMAVAPATLFDDDLDDVTLEPNIGFDVDDDLVGPASSVAGDLRAGSSLDIPPAPGAGFVAHGATTLRYPAGSAQPEADPPLPPAEAPHVASPLTTREVIERARAAARASSSEAQRPRAAAKPTDDSVLQGLSFGRSRRKPVGPAGALMVASLMAAVGLSAGGYVFFESKPGGKLPKRVADALSVMTGDSRNSAGDGGASLAAVALTPKPDAAATAGADMSNAYSAAIAKVAAGQAGGLAELRKLADGGYAPAEFYLAELYQNGKAGLKKDAVQSRSWLQRAAEGGDRGAMYNLALDQHEGVGGPKDGGAAAEWFRRAAELGLVDSQFNLASIYEHGDHVSLNPAESYKWYLIASRAGDAEAKAGALRVREGLSADARAVAERAAAEFQPTQPGPAATTLAASAAAGPAAAPSPDLVTAQRALNQLGYYQGPTDGAPSQALHLAIAAYQRDQSLPVTGAPDAATIGKLAVYTR